MEPLRGDVDIYTALAVGDDEPRLGTEECLVLNADLVDALDRHVTLRLRIAVPDHHVTDDVRSWIVAVSVPHRGAPRVQRLRLGRTLHLGDGGKLLIDDADRGGGSARLLWMLGRDEGDSLAEVADTFGRKHGLVGELEPVGLLPRNVIMGQHRMDTRHGQRRRDVDLDDARMRVWAAKRVAP